MLQVVSGKISYTFNQCQQCGACVAICPKGALSFTLRNDRLKEIEVDTDKCILCKRCVNVCPSHRKLLDNSYVDRFADKRYALAYHLDNNIRYQSSSGGACKTLIIESLKNGNVDAVYTLKRISDFPFAEGEFYTKDNLPDYDTIPNSVYHSITACSELKKIKKVHRLMIVGTSCQLYALEKASKGKYDELIKVCIFCKQQKTWESTRFFAKLMKEDIQSHSPSFVQYRGMGWPGKVCLNQSKIPYSFASPLPFGRRLWTVPGCNVCGDPFGMEVGADLSLMDPWGIRKPNDLGETLITIHTEQGKELLEATKLLGCEYKTYLEIRNALGLDDVERKRLCVPYFRGDMVSENVSKACKAELRQRRFLQKVLMGCPSLPIIFYRILHKILPHKRDQILKL